MRVVVVGSSVAGMSVAALLGRTSHEVVLLERTDGARSSRGAGLAVFPALVREVTGRPIEEMCVNHVTEIELAQLDGDGSTTTTLLPDPGYATSWSALYQELARSTDVTAVTGWEVENLTERRDGVRVEASDGRTLDADLVVVAGGYATPLRRFVDPEHVEPTYAGYVAFRGVLDEGTLDRRTLDLLPPQRQLRYFGPDRYAVSYVMPGPDDTFRAGRRQLNWGFLARMDEPAMTEALRSEAGDRRRTVERGQLRPGVSDEVLAHIDGSWPEYLRIFADHTRRHNALMASAIYEYSPNRLAADRIALIGDAAHTASPTTGAGAAAAMRDAVALTEALLTTPHVPAALREYERQRLHLSRDLVAVGHEIGEAFLRSAAMRSSRSVGDAHADRARRLARVLV